ncbi:MAG: hypothetical protein IIB16_08135 [Chloroflexi bacterium]|nr:hypothetical protein [Chloroflexota bacterium]MCH8869077.1 hypothetical protein [Chloroflexota bacterium]MCH9040424.1 hypothetical protein [Chloroflexota bacterium]
MREYKPSYQGYERSYKIRRRLGIFVMFMGVGALVTTFLGWQVATMADTTTEFALPFLGSIAGVFLAVMLSVVILVFLNPWMEEEDWK